MTASETLSRGRPSDASMGSADPAEGSVAHHTTTDLQDSLSLANPLDGLFEQYRGTTLEVSFRDMVGPLPSDESTHGLYPYPARLLRQIPRLLLASPQVIQGIDHVIDPFCGAGTVLVEAQMRGIESTGIEQNPIAALASRVKTTRIDVSEFESVAGSMLNIAKRTRRAGSPPTYLRRWYSPEAYSALGRLAVALADVEAPMKDAVSLALALTARSCALTDSRVPVPVLSKSPQAVGSADVWSRWQNTARRISRRLRRLPAAGANAVVVTGDSRQSTAWARADRLPGKSLVFTSPPYGAAQKYIRSTSLELGWLGFANDRGTIELERQNIGREHLAQAEREASRSHTFHPLVEQAVSAARAVSESRGAIYSTYFADMMRVFDRMGSRSARIVLVSGTNTVGNLEIDTYSLLGTMLQEQGFRRVLSLRDEIRGRSFMTKRRSDAAPARAEYIEIFERENE